MLEKRGEFYGNIVFYKETVITWEDKSPNKNSLMPKDRPTGGLKSTLMKKYVETLKFVTWFCLISWITVFKKQYFLAISTSLSYKKSTRFTDITGHFKSKP